MSGGKKGLRLPGAHRQQRAAPHNVVGRRGWEWGWVRSGFAQSSLEIKVLVAMGDMEGLDVNATWLSLNCAQHCWGDTEILH